MIARVEVDSCYYNYIKKKVKFQFGILKSLKFCELRTKYYNTAAKNKDEKEALISREVK